MTKKLSFQELQDICTALGTFANARLQEKPDKDLILTIEKIDGREVLQVTRLSNMPWKARLIRLFGVGGSTLSSVSHFIQNNEPYLPSIDTIAYKSHSSYYTEEAMEKLAKIEKVEWNTLRKQKARGCEVLKNCLSHHNAYNPIKAYMLLQEHEKEDLRTNTTIDTFYSAPNPMSFLQDKEKKALYECYKLPIIEQNQFLYLDPFFRSVNTNITPKVLGFCYEHGLGAKKNIELAIHHYQIAVDQNEYSACYNLACLRLSQVQVHIQEVIRLLLKAEDILLMKIDNAPKLLKLLRSIPFNKTPTRKKNETFKEFKKRKREIDTTELKNSHFMKTWNKALKKIYLAFIEVYTRTDENFLREEYEQKVKISLSDRVDELMKG